MNYGTGFQNEQNEIFTAKIKDLFDLSNYKNMVKFSHFLDEKQSFVAEQIANTRKEQFLLFGGYDGAKRKMLGVFPDYMEPNSSKFPFSAICIQYKKEYGLTHRDFLGTLMALQIKRELIGDILVDEGKTIIFISDTAKPLVMNEVKKIGRVGVEITEPIGEKFCAKDHFAEIKGTVASLRLDCIVSLLTGKSREKSALLIKSGVVMVNYSETQGVSLSLHTDDIIAIRGYGKFIVTDDIKPTKKDRLHVVVKKYV
ncbi:MAG: hypothetical protein K0R90_79 [Oscillospiraceae bacterium]|jgi:RNA-binding protein YlmH|nr:hypothetical protein [Oscillospiraceae bacterium]